MYIVGTNCSNTVPAAPFFRTTWRTRETFRNFLFCTLLNCCCVNNNGICAQSCNFHCHCHCLRRIPVDLSQFLHRHTQGKMRRFCLQHGRAVGVSNWNKSVAFFISFQWCSAPVRTRHEEIPLSRNAICTREDVFNVPVTKEQFGINATSKLVEKFHNNSYVDPLR